MSSTSPTRIRMSDIQGLPSKVSMSKYQRGLNKNSIAANLKNPDLKAAMLENVFRNTNSKGGYTTKENGIKIYDPEVGINNI